MSNRLARGWRGTGARRLHAILLFGLTRSRAILSRIAELLGFREQRDLPDLLPFLEDRLVLADLFRRRGDAVLSKSDLSCQGRNHVVAIRSYADALSSAFPDIERTMESKGTELPELLERQLVEVVARSEVSSEDLRRVLCSSIVELLEHPNAHSQHLAAAMRLWCELALGESMAKREFALRARLKRPLRLAITSLVAIGLGALAMSIWSARTDLTRGKKWRASSTLVECRPIEKGGCTIRQGIFFHTREEENPWIEYDLENRARFSKIEVENARDAYRERAIPLIVEVSNDRAKWQEIARMTTDFEVWKTSFPAVTARYVRLRVPRISYLHLARVEIRK